MKISMSTLILVLFGLSGSAFARDSHYSVCSDTPMVAGERMALSVVFHEFRAEDGMNRREVLSVVYQDDLFQSSSLAQDGEQNIILKNRADSASVLFSGKYTYDWEKGTLTLKGSINQLPGSSEGQLQPLNVKLSCKDLSV